MDIDEIRNKVLIAREGRALLRKQCSQSGCGSVSLSLNIPGYPKTMPLLSEFFDDVLSDFKKFLQSHRVFIDTAQELRLADEAGDFYLAPVRGERPPEAIKHLAEGFEERHPLGRIIDIDIADRRRQPLSSGKLKRCLLCEQSAIVCMREGSHTFEELRECIFHKIGHYLADGTRRRTCRQLAALALKAILYEISLSPKPGLVGRFEQGAHKDMDYFTFVASTSALAGYFEELAQSGYMFEGNELRDALPAIREVGLRMESAMYSATNGVNTQKGLIFLMGLALFSTARCIARGGAFLSAECRGIIASICANIVHNELTAQDGGDGTHGSVCYRRYGPEGGGARKEAEEGLPSVFDQGLPGLKSALSRAGEPAAAEQINRALTRTLLRLMAATSDTNILYRKGMQTLHTVRQLARHVLDAADEATEAERYAQLLQFCQRENVSPGGSADLLAVTVFLYFVEQAFRPL